MDNLALNLLVKHLKPRILDKRIENISAARTGLLFHLENGPLFFSLLQKDPLLVPLEQGSVDSGAFAPLAGRFSSLLEGFVIRSMDKEPSDRIIHFSLKSTAGNTFNLYYEAIPRRVDLILTDAAGTVIARVRNPRVETDTYSPPAALSGAVDIFQSDDPETIRLIEKAAEGDEPIQALVKEIKGVDPVFAEELFDRFKKGEKQLKDFLKRVRNGDYCLALFGEGETDQELQLLPSIYCFTGKNRIKEFDSPLEAAEVHFRRRARAFEMAAIRAELRLALNSRRKRIRKTGATLKKDLEKTKTNATLGNIGDLILANIHLLKKGMESAEVVDYFDGEGGRITITLDPALDPSANADRYYRKARKAKRGSEHLQKRIRQLESEENEVEQFAAKIESVEDLKQLRKLRDDLVEKGWITQQQRKKLKVVRQPGRRFLSSDGVEIIIGRNDKDNEVVSFKVARDNDFWMHAAGVSGSHVVVRNPQRRDEMLPDTFREAAALAAYYSKARNSSNVQIHWTKRRFIKKLKGGQPGKVIVSGYRSTTAKPEIPPSVKVIR